MFVKDVVRFTESDIIEKQKSCENEYWDKALDFFMQNKNRHIETMTKSQKMWLLKISEQIGE